MAKAICHVLSTTAAGIKNVFYGEIVSLVSIAVAVIASLLTRVVPFFAVFLLGSGSKCCICGFADYGLEQSVK